MNDCRITPRRALLSGTALFAFALFALPLAPAAVSGEGGTITTVAGTGEIGFGGDGGPATQAQLNEPYGLAFGPDAALYIADTRNHRIRRLGSDGIVQTVVGTGQRGFGGDQGPATSAKLAEPTSLTFDQAGNLYIADNANYRIRRVEAATGTISTVAGSGAQGDWGDGGPATRAAFGKLYDVAISPRGDICIADDGNHKIRCVDRDTGILSTIAGTGGQGFSGDGGPATQAQLKPDGLTFVGDDLYFADQYNHRIRRIDAAGIITTVAGSGSVLGTQAARWGKELSRTIGHPGRPYPGWIMGDGGLATNASLAFPFDVAFDAAGRMLIADSLPQRIRMVDENGIIHTVAGDGWAAYQGDGGPAWQASMFFPADLALGPDGALYVADSWNHRVRQVTPPFASAPEEMQPLPPASL